MAVLRLYGIAQTTCTQRVAIIMHEKKVPFQLVELDWKNNEHKSPEYLEKQPFGQVPYLDDDGFILYESRAICRYIAAKYAKQGTPLIPEDPKGNAIFEQAASVETQDFEPYALGAVAEKVFKPKRNLPTDQSAFEKHIENLSAKLDVYDIILSKQKYLAGNELTLADLFHIPHGSLLTVAGSNVMDTRPNVARWFNDITSRESWQAVKNGVKSTV